MTTDKNRFVAEKLGLCWHEWDRTDNRYPTLRCKYCGICKTNPKGTSNPDFRSDAGAVQLLRLMTEREDWHNKKNNSGFAHKIGTFGFLLHNVGQFYIHADYITTKGKLLDAVAEWFKEKRLIK